MACRKILRILSFLFVGAIAAGAVQAGSVEIVRPRHLSTVLGASTIELAVRLPDGAEVERLRVTVDGEEIAILTGPPWTVPFDAGDGLRGRRIEATLVLADGRLSQSVVRTSPLRIQQEVEVDLVNLYPIVRDASGDYVTDLTQDEFVVLENGKRQEIIRFSTERKPLRIAIVLDTSYSMEDDKIDGARKAALGFLKALEPQDEGLVIFFSDDVKVVQTVTRDPEELAAAISSAEALGGTALYDAVWRSSKMLEQFDGRRVMVLLSDGLDEAASGFGPGSLHTLEEALTQTIRSEVMVFSIGLGRNLDREFVRQWNRAPGKPAPKGKVSLEKILAMIAENSGGRLLLSPRASRLRKAFAEITDDLRNQYSLAYVPSEEGSPGEKRTIELRVPGRSVEVVARKSYYTRP